MDSTVSVNGSRTASPTEGEWFNINDTCDRLVPVADQPVDEVGSPNLPSPTDALSPFDEEFGKELGPVIGKIDPNGHISFKSLQRLGEQFLKNPQLNNALSLLAGITPLSILPEHSQELPSDVPVSDGAVISSDEMINRAIPVIQDHFPQASPQEARMAAESIVDKFIPQGGNGGCETKRKKKTREIVLLAIAIGTVAITVFLKYRKGDFKNTTPLIKSALEKVSKLVNGAR